MCQVEEVREYEKKPERYSGRRILLLGQVEIRGKVVWSAEARRTNAQEPSKTIKACYVVSRLV